MPIISGPRALLLLMGVLPLSTLAQERWEGEMVLGASASSGNTDTRYVEASMDARYMLARQSHQLRSELFNGESEGRETSNRIAAGYRYTRHWGTANYAFVKLDLETDRPADIDLRRSWVLGMGRELVETERGRWEGEYGYGEKHSAFISSRATQTEPIAYLGLNGKFQLTENTEIKFRIDSDVGNDNVATRMKTSLEVGIADSLSLRVSINARHNSEYVGSQGRHEDVTTSVALVRNF